MLAPGGTCNYIMSDMMLTVTRHDIFSCDKVLLSNIRRTKLSVQQAKLRRHFCQLQKLYWGDAGERTLMCRDIHTLVEAARREPGDAARAVALGFGHVVQPEKR